MKNSLMKYFLGDKNESNYGVMDVPSSFGSNASRKSTRSKNFAVIASVGGKIIF